MATDYWIKREEQKLKAHLTDVTKTEKILHRNLKKASKDIEDEIYKLYSRYSKENRLSYAEANKLLTGPKYKEWRMDLKDYVDEITKTDNKELLLELNTLSAKSSITGLEEQLYQIQKILDREYIFKHKEVKKLLKAGVKNSFTQTAYAIENLNGFHTSFSMISQKDIEDIINLPWSGKNYSNRLWANRTKLKDKVQEQIVQAAIQGKDLRQCIKDVSETMEATREVTKRLINTEHAYACSQGDLKMYEEFGIDRYEYVATLDSKTSNICRGLDGKVYKRSEAISGVNFPPTHPHCRSTTVPADVETLGDETRIAKDSKGNYIYLKADTTYEDYRKALETGDWNNVMHDTKINTEIKKTVVNAHKEMYNIINDESLKDSEKIGEIKDIPKTLSNFESHSKNWYESNIKSKISISDKKIVENTLDDIVRTSEYSIRIKSKDLESLVTDNRFKNQFETNTSGGTVSKDHRREATTQLFGANTKKLKKSDYEKYGYLGNKDYLKDFDHNRMWGGTDQYGDVIFRFDKKALKGRVTMTVNNSLGNAVNKKVIASSTEKANIGCIELNAINKYTDLIKNNKFNSVEDLVNKINVRYIELQYHGKLTLGEVKEVCFTQDVPEKSLIEALKGHNIKAYKIEGDRCVEI